ncbi:hypothetical protein AVEN_149644-1 [Araneus ventricosus]|uniref:Uncharacterized protein n=1 Tax=Araneus ventricosus TaxID=182803 RepID=A0A4Y2LRA9_ARAVE|nr:hypothetical protein AVEN_149644-1 [Araneus ventricosus]
MGVVQCVTPASAVQTSSCIPRPKIIPTTNILGKFGIIPIVIHDWRKNHGLNHLVMEDVPSLKLRPMDAEIGTIYYWIWTADPKSAAEPHKEWSGFMEILAGKRCYEKSAVIPLPFVNLQPFNCYIYVCFSRIRNYNNSSSRQQMASLKLRPELWTHTSTLTSL